jgi:hypothetical protein
MTLPLIGALALAGVGAGVQLGHAALSEINPVYFSDPPTRFHSDLVANPPSTSPPQLVAASAEDPNALGAGCVGCRTYPEEYYPVHDAAIEDPSGVYADEGAKVRVVAAVEEEPDPETSRLQSEIARVERYARGGTDSAPQLASAELTGEAQSQPESVPVTQ